MSLLAPNIPHKIHLQGIIYVICYVKFVKSRPNNNVTMANNKTAHWALSIDFLSQKQSTNILHVNNPAELTTANWQWDKEHHGDEGQRDGDGGRGTDNWWLSTSNWQLVTGIRSQFRCSSGWLCVPKTDEGQRRGQSLSLSLCLLALSPLFLISFHSQSMDMPMNA